MVSSDDDVRPLLPSHRERAVDGPGPSRREEGEQAGDGAGRNAPGDAGRDGSDGSGEEEGTIRPSRGTVRTSTRLGRVVIQRVERSDDSDLSSNGDADEDGDSDEDLVFLNEVLEESEDTDEEGEEEDEEEGDEEEDEAEDDDIDMGELVPLDHPLAQITQLRTAPAGASLIGKKGGKGEGDKRVNTWHMLTARQQNLSGKGHWSRSDCCHVAQRYLPEDGPTIVDTMNSRAYIGQFSKDGRMFVGGFQDRRIRLYQVDRNWALRKDVRCRNLRWTVTDTALSPDLRFLVYASINPVVHLVNVGDESSGVESLANVTDIHEGLDFAGSGRRERTFGIWSLQFSSDGRELVAGSSDSSLYIYDLEANKPVLKVRGHTDDVNAVTFADESSHLIFSGSDDKLVKVWDRRCLQKRSKPAGVLAGHMEGLTFLDSKGDGRYLISNSKDQTIKLWDIRTMMDEQEHASQPPAKLPEYRWDYRWMEYPGFARKIRHPHDRSIMTYRGHKVLQTLIRCYFSPAFSTGQRYIYTGSYDGSVYIYDLVSGAIVRRLKYHKATVRDCSWHPTDPMLATVSWDGKVAWWEHLRGEKAPPFTCNRTLDYDLATDVLDED